MQERLKKLLTTNWHFIGVIFFFLVHGYRQYRELVPLSGMLVLLAVLTGICLVLYGISGWWYKSWRKAGLLTSFTAVVVLFFGVFQDFLSGFRLTAGLSRLLYFIPLCLMAIMVVLVLLKLTRRPLNKPLLFINVVLLTYLLIDIGALLFYKKTSRIGAASAGTWACDTCSRPSIYLVLLDEYMGSQGLQSYFQYNNQPFEDSLRQQGFHVVQRPRSNYILTIFSMASLLNMDFPAGIGRASLKDHYAYTSAVRSIRNNTVSASLETRGYRIANFSGFDMAQAPAGYTTGLLPDKMGLITNQTMWYRIVKYLPAFLVEKGLMSTTWEKKIEDNYIRNNEAAMQGALELGSRNDSVPVFAWLHLMMPYQPFVFDSTGKRMLLYERTSRTADEMDSAYLQYLVYTNHRIYAFLRQLKRQTRGKAVILLMSDHGCRGAMRKDKALAWANFNAVYLPDRQYNGWYDGMTNVNQFRVLFNALFDQRMPMLRDSVIQ